MEKIDLTREFAKRLHQSLLAAGHRSERSSFGVDIHKLVAISGHSSQICRKYLRGQAIPEPIKLAEIAEQLQVSPGWLLYGDTHKDDHPLNKNLSISKELLHYIFTQARELYNTDHPAEEIADFLLDLTNDISQINANEEQSKRIIDLALSSIKHFRLD